MTGAHANASHVGKGKTSAPDDSRSLAYIARQKAEARHALEDGMFLLWCHYVDTRADVKVVEVTLPSRGRLFAVVVEHTDFWLGAYATRDYAADAARKLGCRPSTRIL